jgi:lysyl-tRNA synthetase class 1
MIKYKQECKEITMNWLNQIVDDLIARYPTGEILVESGGSPSGTHHLGHMREFVTADAIMLELRRRGRQARHIYFADDLDGLRKIPVDIPEDFKQYLGMPLCDVPAPDGSDQSYADYFLAQLERSTAALGVEVEFIRAHKKYRSGFFVPAIERSLERVPVARKALETISSRTLDEHWSPIQVLENGRLKNRKFLGIDSETKTIRYESAEGAEQTARYDIGEVKLDWRLDWPGRWWLQHVMCEPSGRDHMTKGGSYDTGVQIMRDVYEAEAPYPVAYDFINMVGDTKKMSASKGTGLDAEEGSTIMPPEVVRYFILRAAPNKRLYFDPINGVVQLMDEFAALAAKQDKTESEQQLLYICTKGQDRKTVSRVPFSHLVASYQASLRDADRTLDVIRRTEYRDIVEEDAEIIRNELRFIDAWLEKRAPEDVKFALLPEVDVTAFSKEEQTFLQTLGNTVATAPPEADGSWFHNAIYELKDTTGLTPKEMFTVVYRALIGQTSGPRAGWFLSILPRDWLIRRLSLQQASNESTSGIDSGLKVG